MEHETIYRSERDPWDRSRHDKPPGLDEVFNSLFGGGGKSPKNILLILFIISALLFVISGFFIVSPAEQGVILRFGKVHRIAHPGPNWMIPGVEKRRIVDVQRIYGINSQAEMLTSDESYADVDVSVFFRIDNPAKYLFNAVDPIDSLTQATTSSLRQIVGSTTLENIITKGRESARDDIKELINEVIKVYDIGLEITDVKLQHAQAPQQVKPAFDDVIQAREDQDRYKMQAEGYRNKVIPEAEGVSRRIDNQAEADYEKIIMDAKAEVAGFNAVLQEYSKNPRIITDRMYLSTMKNIYGRTKKIFVSGDSSLNVLPLGDLVKLEEIDEEK